MTYITYGYMDIYIFIPLLLVDTEGYNDGSGWFKLMEAFNYVIVPFSRRRGHISCFH